MIPTMLALGLVLGLARARWWGSLIAGAAFVVQISLTTDNAPATWIASYALAVVNAGVGWLLGAGVALGVAAGFRRLRGDRATPGDPGNPRDPGGPGDRGTEAAPGDADGPPPRGRAA